ncbi:hypothetical protein ACOSOMT5_P3067 [Acidiphilium sp. MT5]
MPKPAPTEIVFIPALLCDEALYRDVIATAGDAINAHVMISPKPNLVDSVTDILAKAPPKFIVVGTSYGANLALEVAFAAPDRVTGMWLMDFDPGAPKVGGTDLADGLNNQPDAVIDMLAGLVVHQNHTKAAATFKAMAHRIGGKSGAAQATALGTRADATLRLGTLHIPALIVWGKDDALVPVSTGRKLADDLPHAHFHTIPECGHLPTLEKPAEAAALLIDFLNDEPHHGH